MARITHFQVAFGRLNLAKSPDDLHKLHIDTSCISAKQISSTETN